MDKKEIARKNMEELQDLEAQAAKEWAGNRDEVLIEHMLNEDKDLQTDRNVVYKNPNIEWQPTEKYRVAMVMPPAWTILFPPYGIAKLTAVMRKFGYSVKVYDSNIESYHHLLQEHDQDYWTSARYFLWNIEENFTKYLFPDIKDILDKIVDDILRSNVRVVGMSLYNTNIFAAFYMAKRLREENPNLCLLAGGPEVISTPELFQHGGKGHNLFNYLFIGESEENLITFLDNLPEQFALNEIIGSVKSRLDLEALPYADFSDYDIRNYKEHGVPLETSRGCIAQCSFCSETYFWKFRSQEAVKVADEIEFYVNKYKARRFWFTDSLANGDIKRFEKLIDLIRERKISMRWHSYARCDGRMDLVFMRKIVASGCTALSFGVESGSQKVLHDMRKKIEVWEIEDNLRDTRKVGMYNHVNWMVGFPTEEAVDHFHSMQILYNARKWIGTISLGYTTGIAKGSDIETNYKAYDIMGEAPVYNYEDTFLNQWYTKDYKSTIVHRFIRLKLAHVWLEMLKDHRGSIIFNAQQDDTVHSVYTFEFAKVKNELDYLEQDFYVNFNQFQGTFADTVANEYVAFFYLVYKYFPRYKFTFKIDPKHELEVFGSNLVKDYYAEVSFEVNKNGDYELSINHKLSHTTNEEHLESKYEEERNRRDMSFKQKIVKNGHISEWQTKEPVVRETIHAQYRKK